MNPRMLLLLWLLPFGIPFVISIGVVLGIIPLSAGGSPRLPNIYAVSLAFLLSAVIWKWQSPEMQAKFTALSATRKVEKSCRRKLIIAQSLMIVFFTVMGLGVGLFIANAGKIEMSGGLFSFIGILATFLSMVAFFYVKKVQTMAAMSSQDKLSKKGKIEAEAQENSD